MYFLRKGPHNLLKHRETRQHPSTVHGDHLKEWNHQQKAQKYEKCEGKQMEKRTLVYNVSMETRSQSITLFSLSWECVHQTPSFPHFADVHNDHGSAMSLDAGVTNTIYQVNEFANTE